MKVIYTISVLSHTGEKQKDFRKRTEIPFLPTTDTLMHFNFITSEYISPTEVVWDTDANLLWVTFADIVVEDWAFDWDELIEAILEDGFYE